jgi:hypothetical protein
MLDLLGWVATGLVAISYFTKRAVTLRRVQATGACLWLLYGIMIHAQPVIVANVIVIVAALGSSLRPAAKEPATGV